MIPKSKQTTDPEVIGKEWKSYKTVRSPYDRMKLAYQTNFSDGSTSLSEPFEPDDPALIDRFPEYSSTETDIGDRPPTPTPVISSRQRPSKKKKYMSAMPEQGRRT